MRSLLIQARARPARAYEYIFRERALFQWPGARRARAYDEYLLTNTLKPRST